MIVSHDVFYMLKCLGFEKPLYVGIDPDSKESPYTVVRDTGGNPNPRYLRDEFTIQFFSKAAREDYRAAYNALYEIKNKLLGVTTIKVWDVVTEDGEGVQIEDTVYVNFEPNTSDVLSTENERHYIRFLIGADVAMVGQDENNRYFFSLNMDITREERQPTQNRIPIK